MPDGFDSGQTATGAIKGTLTIGARQVPLSLTGDARYDGGAIALTARGSFTWSEVGIRAPNLSGIVQVEDTVHFEVRVAAVPLVQSGGAQ